MNMALHSMVGVASSAILCKKEESLYKTKKKELPLLFAGGTVNILLHGILDLVPHSYPFRVGQDVIVTGFIGMVFFILHQGIAKKC